MFNKLGRHFASSAVAAAVLAATALIPQVAQAGTILDNIKSKGTLRCAVNTGLQGFSAPDSKGQWTGIDAEYCKALAAAILGDASKVEFIPSNTQNRFTLLQSGEVDILSRNTTWTSSRDATLGGVFAGTLFYDGQGFMVRKDLNLKSAKELDGATVCVQPGTTTEQNLSDYFRAQNMNFKPVVINGCSDLLLSVFGPQAGNHARSAVGVAELPWNIPVEIEGELLIRQ